MWSTNPNSSSMENKQTQQGKKDDPQKQIKNNLNPKMINITSEIAQPIIPTSSRFDMLILASSEPISHWNIEKVGDWIEELSNKIDIGDGKVLKQKFIGNRMNGSRLMSFTVDAGKSMEIPTGDSIDIEKAISNLKQSIFHIQNSSFVEKRVREEPFEPSKKLKVDFFEKYNITKQDLDGEDKASLLDKFCLSKDLKTFTIQVLLQTQFTLEPLSGRNTFFKSKKRRRRRD